MSQTQVVDPKIKFVAIIRHLAWYCHMRGANKDANIVPTQEQLTSLMDGVKFNITNPEVSARDMHENWVKYKLANGWEFGPEKDEINKKHPNLLPYNQLSEFEREKDAIGLLAQQVALKLWEDMH